MSEAKLPNLSEREIIYDWNQFIQSPAPAHRFELSDETLRDGLQSPSAIDPPLEKKIEILHLMHSLGIDAADLGLPGAGPHVVKTVEALTREILEHKLCVKPNCAARTVVSDIEPIAEISQRVGIEIEVMAFIGSSPVRIYTEDWDEPLMLQRVRDAVSFSIKHNLSVCFVTEDTIRARPEMIRSLYCAALDAGAKRVCLCDTVGHATPDGTQALVRYMREKILKAGGYTGVKVDWHGHNDRGHAVPNALSAIEAGADRVHATALGIGEKCGNTAIDQLLVNLYLLGWYRHDLNNLMKYCETVSEAVGHPIPENYPVIGRDAFRTATGVHAAAVIKAEKKGDAWLADRVYSGVPAGVVGRKQRIEVGPVSGESNVIFWLQTHGVEPKPEIVRAVFQKAKQSNHVLSEMEIRETIQKIVKG